MGHVLINQHLVSRSIFGVYFSFIPCVELKIPGGIHPPRFYVNSSNSKLRKK